MFAIDTVRLNLIPLDFESLTLLKRDRILLEKHLNLNFTGHKVSFEVQEEIKKEIGSINERSYWRAEDKDKKYYFNTYATSCEDEFEFRRLIFNGRVAERMLNDMDSIKEAFMIPFSKKADLEALASEYQILSAEIKQKDYQIQIPLALLKQGIHFAAQQPSRATALLPAMK